MRSEQKKIKIGISTSITMGILILVALVITLTTISYYSLKRFEDGVVDLSSTALPALADVASLNAALDDVVLNAVELARVDSHAERRISISESRNGLQRVELMVEKLQAQQPDQLFSATLQVLGKSIEDLNQYKSGHLDALLAIHQAENRLSEYTAKIASDLRQLDMRAFSQAERIAFSEWQAEIVLITINSIQATRMTSMRDVRRLQSVIRKKSRALSTLHVSGPPEILAFQTQADTALSQNLFERDGLFPTARSALQMRLRTSGIARQMRVLVNEMIKSMAILSETINEQATENTTELVNVAHSQIQYLQLAAAAAFFIAVAVFFYFDRRITGRLLALNTAVIARTEGSKSIIPISGQDEIAEIGRSVSYFIGEIDQRQKRLLTSEQQFRDIVEGSVQAILIVANNAPLFWNQTLTKMFDLDTLGEDGDFAAIVSKLPAEALEQPTLGEIRTYNRVPIPAKTGSEKWADLATTAIHWNGKPATQIILADVTHNILAEKSLKIAKEKAEDAADAKTQFLATMSHEIRSPMNGIISMSQLLQENELNAEQHNMTSIINQSARALLSIIDDILDFSKIESGKLDIENTQFSIRALIKSVVELMAPKIQAAGLEFILDIGLDVPKNLQGDPNRLRQVLINLIGNAEKFTKSGSIIVRVQTLGEVKTGNLSVKFEVEDTGIGIEASALPKLFTPFEQAEASTARRYGGSGLGLSICKRLTELMGGSIKASSSPGEGSTFTFELPFKCDPDSKPKSGIDLSSSIVVLRVNSAVETILANIIKSTGAKVIVAHRTDDVASLTPKRAIMLLESDLISNDEIAQRLIARTLRETDSRAVIMEPYCNQFDPEKFQFPVRSHLYKPSIAKDLLRKLAAAYSAEAENQNTTDDQTPTFTAPDRDLARSHGSLILAAEDNPVNQMVIQKTLGHLGFPFDLAANGKEALEMFQKESYGLVLTDLHMPEMDGLALVEAIRSQSSAKARHVPILALSADVLPETKEKCTQLGVNGFLQKPIELMELEAAISHWLPAADQLRRGNEPEQTTQNKTTPNNKDAAEEPSPETLAPADIFDPNQIAFIFDESWDEGITLIERFIAILEEKSTEAINALDQGDLRTATESIHAAKGAASSVGAVELANHFKEIETSLREKAIEVARKQLASVNKMMARFEQTVKNTYPKKQSS